MVAYSFSALEAVRSRRPRSVARITDLCRSHTRTSQLCRRRTPSPWYVCQNVRRRELIYARTRTLPPSPPPTRKKCRRRHHCHPLQPSKSHRCAPPQPRPYAQLCQIASACARTHRVVPYCHVTSIVLGSGAVHRSRLPEQRHGSQPLAPSRHAVSASQPSATSAALPFTRRLQGRS